MIHPSKLQFGELPQSNSRSTGSRSKSHQGVAARLKEQAQIEEQKNVWAKVHTAKTRSSADSIAHQIRSGRNKAYTPAGTFEASARSIDNEFHVYARYVGTGSDPE